MIKKVYEFNAKIGEGSYGHVYKATTVKLKAQKRNPLLDMKNNFNVTH